MQILIIFFFSWGVLDFISVKMQIHWATETYTCNNLEIIDSVYIDTFIYIYIHTYYIEIALNALEKFVRSQCIWECYPTHLTNRGKEWYHLLLSENKSVSKPGPKPRNLDLYLWGMLHSTPMTLEVIKSFFSYSKPYTHISIKTMLNQLLASSGCFDCCKQLFIKRLKIGLFHQLLSFWNRDKENVSIH